MTLEPGMRVRCVDNSGYSFVQDMLTVGRTYTVSRDAGQYFYLSGKLEGFAFRVTRFKPLIRVKMGRAAVPEPAVEPPK